MSHAFPTRRSADLGQRTRREAGLDLAAAVRAGPLPAPRLGGSRLPVARHRGRGAVRRARHRSARQARPAVAPPPFRDPPLLRAAPRPCSAPFRCSFFLLFCLFFFFSFFFLFFPF